MGRHLFVHKNISLAPFFFLKKNLNAPRPSEHVLVRGESVKTFTSRWDHRPRRQNLFMALKRVPLW